MAVEVDQVLAALAVGELPDFIRAHETLSTHHARPGAEPRPQSETRGAGVSAPSIDDHEERLPFLDDVRGQQRRAAAADIPHRVDRLRGTINASPAFVSRQRPTVDRILDRSLQIAWSALGDAYGDAGVVRPDLSWVPTGRNSSCPVAAASPRVGETTALSRMEQSVERRAARCCSSQDPSDGTPLCDGLSPERLRRIVGEIRIEHSAHHGTV